MDNIITILEIFNILLIFGIIVFFFVKILLFLTLPIIIKLGDYYDDKLENNNNSNIDNQYIDNNIKYKLEKIVDEFTEKINKQELYIKQLNLEIENCKQQLVNKDESFNEFKQQLVNREENFNELKNLVKNIEFMVYYNMRGYRRDCVNEIVNNTELLNMWLDFDYIKTAIVYSYFIIDRPKKNLYFYDSLKQYSENLDYNELVEKFDEMIKKNIFIKNEITKKYESNPMRCNENIFIKKYLSNELSELSAQVKAKYIISTIIGVNDIISGRMYF